MNLKGERMMLDNLLEVSCKIKCNGKKRKTIDKSVL